MSVIQIIKSIPLSKSDRINLVMVDSRFGPKFQVQMLVYNPMLKDWIKTSELMEPTNEFNAKAAFSTAIGNFKGRFSEADLAHSSYVGGKSL